MKTIGRLHIVTDFFLQQRFSHAELARQAIEGGADTIQFREKRLPIRHPLHEARKTAAVCKAYGIPLLIDDRLEVMLATGAAGVHLGQTDFPIPDARRILGPVPIIGATATTTGEAVRACEEGADYIGFGPVYPTRSKANPAPVKGLDGLREACRAVPIPVIAIAGITPERVTEVIDAGAHGVAVLSSVCLAPSPEAATASFRAAIDRALT